MEGQGSFDEPPAEQNSEKEEPAAWRQCSPKPREDGKVVEQKSLNKILLKAILKTHQTMRDLSSTVWDTLLIKASSPVADNMQKQTQTYAEKVRQESERTYTKPTIRVGILGLGQVSPAEGQRSGREISTGHSGILGQTGTALSNADLRRGALLQAGHNVQSRHQESDAEHCFTGEAAPRSRSTQQNRARAQVRTGSTDSYGKRAASVPGRSAEDVKIIVKGIPR